MLSGLAAFYFEHLKGDDSECDVLEGLCWFGNTSLIFFKWTITYLLIVLIPNYTPREKSHRYHKKLVLMFELWRRWDPQVINETVFR